MAVETVLSFGSGAPIPIPKPEKGKSLLEIPTDYTIVDLETTGLEPSCNEIIEVACIKYRNNVEVARFESLVQPEPYRDYLNDDEDEPTGELRYVDDFIIKLTGITNEMLATAPKFETIANELYAFLDGETIVGHNVNFDIRFLLEEFRWKCDLPFKNDFVDTLRLSRRILPDMPHHTLKDMKEHFGISIPHHRAMADCLAANEVLNRLAGIVKDNNIDLDALSKKKKDFDLRTLTCDGSQIDQSSVFFGKRCCFTGELVKFARKEAAQIVVNIGGFCDNNVTKKTNFLVIGGLTRNTVTEGKSNKIIKAEKLKQKGNDIQIISEDTFYELISD